MLGLLWMNKAEIALPMTYFSLGGVVCSMTVLHRRAWLLPIPAIAIFLTLLLGEHLKQSVKILLPCLCMGFLIALALGSLASLEAKSKKKTSPRTQ